MYQFKAKRSEIKQYLLYLGYISKDFTANNMKNNNNNNNKTGLNNYVHDFFVDYNTIDNSIIINIHNYLMKKTQNIVIFGFIKKMFIGLLTNINYASTMQNVYLK